MDIVNGENLNESEIRLSLPAGVRSGLDKKSRFVAWECLWNRGLVGNRMFPRAQLYLRCNGAKREPEGPILLNSSGMNIDLKESV